jgi:hypothetical protein
MATHIALTWTHRLFANLDQEGETAAVNGLLSSRNLWSRSSSTPWRAATMSMPNIRAALRPKILLCTVALGAARPRPATGPLWGSQ